MNVRRIKSILLQEWFVLYRSGEVITDIIVFPVGHIIVFGFISLFLSKENPEVGQIVLLGMILWQVIWIVEYALTLGSLWNIWSRNLTNLFIAPLSLAEYIFAHTFSGVLKALLVLAFGAVLSLFVFDFNLLSAGLGSLFLAFVNLSLFAYAIGVAILGLIFRYGTRVQAAAWGLVTILQPLMAPFYPVEIMPVALQYVSYLFPATYVFEAARYSLLHGGDIAWGLYGIAFAGNVVYCLGCTHLFLRFYRASRDSGQFARNEV